jgi:hypothetical protein
MVANSGSHGPSLLNRSGAVPAATAAMRAARIAWRSDGRLTVSAAVLGTTAR